MPEIIDYHGPATPWQHGPLLPCGDARCQHGLTAHSITDNSRCEWVGCPCKDYQWAETEAAR